MEYRRFHRAKDIIDNNGDMETIDEKTKEEATYLIFTDAEKAMEIIKKRMSKDESDRLTFQEGNREESTFGTGIDR